MHDYEIELINEQLIHNGILGVKAAEVSDFFTGLAYELRSHYMGTSQYAVIYKTANFEMFCSYIYRNYGIVVW